VRVVVPLLLACAISLPICAQREGNFKIRFEPKVVLQTGVQVPFEISVSDALKQPLTDAQVTLSVETSDQHEQAKTFRAPAVGAGVYVAKPIFPTAGQWDVLVEVKRADQSSSRMIQFSVKE